MKRLICLILGHKRDWFTEWDVQLPHLSVETGWRCLRCKTKGSLMKETL